MDIKELKGAAEKFNKRQDEKQYQKRSPVPGSVAEYFANEAKKSKTFPRLGNEYTNAINDMIASGSDARIAPDNTWIDGGSIDVTGGANSDLIGKQTSNNMKAHRAAFKGAAKDYKPYQKLVSPNITITDNLSSRVKDKKDYGKVMDAIESGELELMDETPALAALSRLLSAHLTGDDDKFNIAWDEFIDYANEHPEYMGVFRAAMRRDKDLYDKLIAATHPEEVEFDDLDDDDGDEIDVVWADDLDVDQQKKLDAMLDQKKVKKEKEEAEAAKAAAEKEEFEAKKAEYEALKNGAELPDTSMKQPEWKDLPSVGVPMSHVEAGLRKRDKEIAAKEREEKKKDIPEWFDQDVYDSVKNDKKTGKPTADYLDTIRMLTKNPDALSDAGPKWTLENVKRHRDLFEERDAARRKRAAAAMASKKRAEKEAAEEAMQINNAADPDNLGGREDSSWGGQSERNADLSNILSALVNRRY